MNHLTPAVQFSVGSKMKQFRFVPFALGKERAFLVVHSACAEVDPYHKMFFLPTDTLKLTAFDSRGRRLWQRDLGGGMIPGIWFCPVLPFDLDGDGVDEVYLVDNKDTDHALNFEGFVLERLSGRTGEVLARWPWSKLDDRQPMSHKYRNFIVGGFSKGRQRLVCCQGTYEDLQFQCYDSQMKQLWSRRVERADPGARGSHMCPVIDIDSDGRDELLYGERCMDIDTGRDIWIADADGWHGHSDVIQPTLDLQTGRWSVYTCRESDTPSRGVVMFDDHGKELWGRRGMGHMDMGWTARLRDDGGHLCYALEIGQKSAGPGGFQRGNVVEYLFDMEGGPLKVEFPLFMTLPVDFDGDGLHELMYTGGERRALVVSRRAEPLYQLEGEPAYGGKLLDAPGEQIVTWDGEGNVRIYACDRASDTPAAKRRYEHPYYAACRRLWAVGYNKANLGGL